MTVAEELENDHGLSVATNCKGGINGSLTIVQKKLWHWQCCNGSNLDLHCQITSLQNNTDSFMKNKIKIIEYLKIVTNFYLVTSLGELQCFRELKNQKGRGPQRITSRIQLDTIPLKTAKLRYHSRPFRNPRCSKLVRLESLLCSGRNRDRRL